MKLLELYSLASGLKIGKQHLLSQFFPLPFTRYITLHAASGMPAKNWPYYALAVELIKPYLDRYDIHIVQLGIKDDPAIPGCHHTMGKTSEHQANYLVERTLLHLGNDSVWAHRAGHLNLPLVALYGSTTSENHGPLEFDPQKSVFLSSHRWNRNPSFASQEAPQSIGVIDPFEVARSVLNLLAIPNTVVQKTLNIGPVFQAEMLEWVPNELVNPTFNPQLPLAARMDLAFNEAVLVQALQTGRKINIVTKTPLNLQVLQAFKDSILSYNHELDESTPKEYVLAVKKLIRQHTFFSRTKNEEVLAKLRFAFFDVANIEQVTDRTKPDFEKAVREYTNNSGFSLDSELKLGTMVFKSQKYVLSKGKIYLSMAHEKADKPVDSPEGNRVMDDEDWYRDTNHFFVYT